MIRQPCRSLLLLSFLLAVAPAAGDDLAICRFHDQAQQIPIGIELPGSGPRYAPDRVVDVTHIKLDVTPDFATRSIRAVASIRFRPIARPVTQIRLDGIDLDVQSIESEVPIEDYTVTRREVTVLFAEPIPADSDTTVHIRYRAFPERGLYFRTADMGYPAQDTHLWTQGEAHESRFWYPCFDYPNERSSSEVICHVPSDMTVLSNGRRVSESVDPQTGLKSVHWLQEKPHANYLICLVAGYFRKLEDRHDDVPLGFYTQPSLFEYAANSFQDTRQIMAFYEEEIGVPFPWDKYDQVTIVDFVAGGMENTSLTTLTHNTIFTKETENIRTSRGLDAHEMAHQWFGDYVTCKDWSHLWLNEGFATFYALLYEGHKFGRDELLYGLYQDARGSILPRADDRRPIVYKGYDNAEEQFDYRAYPKGSWVLHMLRSQLGEDLYRKAIRTYLERHALHSVVTEDLRQVMEELSGRTLDRFFDQWVYHAGFPDLRITYRWLPEFKLAKVTVEQTQETNDDVMTFNFPTELRFISEDGEVVDHPVQITEKKHEFFVPLEEEPKIVRFDPRYTVLARVTFEKPDAMLRAQLERTDDVIGRLRAATALAGRNSPEAVKALAKALNEDPFYGVRIAASEALRRNEHPDAFPALLGGLDQSDARVRLQVVQDVTSVYSREAWEATRKVLESERNPAILAVAIRALGQRSEPESRKLLIEYLQSQSFRNELAVAALDGIAALNDPEMQAAVRRVLRERQEAFTTRGLAQGLRTLGRIARYADRTDRARMLLVSFTGDPREAIRIAALQALGSLGDPEAHGVVESFRQDGNLRVAQAARGALEEIDRQRPLSTAELDQLRSTLRELQDEHRRLKDQIEALEARQKAAAGEQ